MKQNAWPAQKKHAELGFPEKKKKVGWPTTTRPTIAAERNLEKH